MLRMVHLQVCLGLPALSTSTQGVKLFSISSQKSVPVSSKNGKSESSCCATSSPRVLIKASWFCLKCGALRALSQPQVAEACPWGVGGEYFSPIAELLGPNTAISRSALSSSSKCIPARSNVRAIFSAQLLTLGKRSKHGGEIGRGRLK